MQGFDDRFDVLERRMDGLERRIDALDSKVDRFREEISGRIESLGGSLGGRLDVLDQKISRHFTWTVGIQVAVLLAVVAALAGR